MKPTPKEEAIILFDMILSWMARAEFYSDETINELYALIEHPETDMPGAMQDVLVGLISMIRDEMEED